MPQSMKVRRQKKKRKTKWFLELWASIELTLINLIDVTQDQLYKKKSTSAISTVKFIV